MSTTPAGSAPRPGPHVFGQHVSPGTATSAVSAYAQSEGDRAHAARSNAPEQPGTVAGAADPTGSPHQLADLPPTGEPRVDECMARLAELAGRPVAEQVAEFGEIHQTLQDTLATVDDA